MPFDFKEERDKIDAKRKEEEQKQRAAWDLWDAGDDDYKINPRGWLLGTTFCRRFLSSLIADGGVGKTAVRVAQLISLALGKSLTGEHVFQRSRVLVISLEDDRDELRRRVLAVLLHHKIKPEELKGWLFLVAPKGLKLAEINAEGSQQAGMLEKLIREAVGAYNLDIVSLDPFIKSHGLDENSNNAIDYVCCLLVSIAIDCNCAVDFPHHTSKGLTTAGDANKGRGASSMKDAARLVYTLTPMSDEEAKQFSLSEADRRSLIRLDSGKVNIAPPSEEAAWFRLVGVPLENTSDTYPAGDNIQTVVPWIPPDTWEGLDSRIQNRMLDDIEAGMPNGQRYSGAASATKRAAWRVVQNHAEDKSEKQCRGVISGWLKSGVLVTEDYDDSVERKIVSGLRVVASRRPSR